MHKQVKTVLYDFFYEVSDCPNFYSLADEVIVPSLIFLNLTAFIASTSPSFSLGYQLLFEYIAIIYSLVFTLEYVLRMWVCTVDSKYSHPIWGRLKIRSHTADREPLDFNFTLLLLFLLSQFKIGLYNYNFALITLDKNQQVL